MSKPLPPFKYLIAFDAAARLGSFSKASEELSLTQSAISQQLLKLEELLGQSLFLETVRVSHSLRRESCFMKLCVKLCLDYQQALVA